MGLIGWIVLGGLAGWVASIIMGTNRSQGLLRDILVGVGGGIVGGFLGGLLGFGGVNAFDVRSFLIALGGAVLLLALFGRRR